MTIWHLKWNAQMIFLRILERIKQRSISLWIFYGNRKYAREFQKEAEEKNLDMIIANSLKMEGAGFGGNTNVVTVITEDFEKSSAS